MIVAWLGEPALVSVQGLEEVGVDEGEEEDADAFDLDGDVAVARYAHHRAFVAGEDAAGDADALRGLEVVDVIYPAAGGVVGGEELQQVHLALGNGLDLVAVGVAVDPEGYGAGLLAPFGFVGQGVVGRGTDEDYVGYDGAATPLAGGGGHRLDGEVYVVARGAEGFRGAEVLAGAYGVPVGHRVSN